MTADLEGMESWSAALRSRLRSGMDPVGIEEAARKVVDKVPDLLAEVRHLRDQPSNEERRLRIRLASVEHEVERLCEAIAAMLVWAASHGVSENGRLANIYFIGKTAIEKYQEVNHE